MSDTPVKGVEFRDRSRHYGPGFDPARSRRAGYFFLGMKPARWDARKGLPRGTGDWANGRCTLDLPSNTGLCTADRKAAESRPLCWFRSAASNGYKPSNMSVSGKCEGTVL